MLNACWNSETDGATISSPVSFTDGSCVIKTGIKKTLLTSAIFSGAVIIILTCNAGF